MMGSQAMGSFQSLQKHPRYLDIITGPLKSHTSQAVKLLIVWCGFELITDKQGMTRLRPFNHIIHAESHLTIPFHTLICILFRKTIHTILQSPYTRHMYKICELVITINKNGLELSRCTNILSEVSCEVQLPTLDQLLVPC